MLKIPDTVKYKQDPMHVHSTVHIYNGPVQKYAPIHKIHAKVSEHITVYNRKHIDLVSFDIWGQSEKRYHLTIVRRETKDTARHPFVVGNEKSGAKQQQVLDCIETKKTSEMSDHHSPFLSEGLSLVLDVSPWFQDNSAHTEINP